MSRPAIGAHPLAPGAVRAFVEGGNATFTVRNARTGGRYTYRVARNEDQNGAARAFVAVLNGPDNGRDYAHIGFIGRRDGAFVRSRQSPLPSTALSVRGFDWVWSHVDRLADYPHVEVHHVGKCGRCGRPLTVPSSITTGLGPVCAQRV